MERHGLTPTAYVAQLGLLNLPGPSLVAHCNVVSEDGIATLARTGAYVAHTPKTYLKLGMRMPPLLAMVNAGVQVALGTDGLASNSDLNLLEVTRCTGAYQKGYHRQPDILSRTELLRMICRLPAQALGFEESGTIAAGQAADLVLLSTQAPHWIPRHDVAAAVVYTAHTGDVVYVWSDGELLYRQGEYLTLDIERIRWEAERRAFRMVGKDMSSMRAYPS